MPDHKATAWVRTRVTPRTKEWCHQAAKHLDWNVTGVESAAIAYTAAVMSPQEFADFIRATLLEATPKRKGGD